MSRRFMQGSAIIIHELGEALPLAKYKVIIWRTRRGLVTEALRNGKGIVRAPTKVRDLDITYWLNGGVIQVR